MLILKYVKKLVASFFLRYVGLSDNGNTDFKVIKNEFYSVCLSDLSNCLMHAVVMEKCVALSIYFRRSMTCMKAIFTVIKYNIL